MLARTEFHNVAGTRVVMDLVELPSIFMENFARSFEFLLHTAKHHQTNLPPSPQLLKKAMDMQHLFYALDTQQQIFLSALDQHYHLNTNTKLGFSYEILQKVQEQYGIYPYEKGTNLATRFTHIYTYGACYYTYLMGRVLSKMIWDLGFSKNPLDPNSGHLFQKYFLSVGGSVKPWKSISETLFYIAQANNSQDEFLDKLKALENGGSQALDLVSSWNLHH